MNEKKYNSQPTIIHMAGGKFSLCGKGKTVTHRKDLVTCEACKLKLKTEEIRKYL